MGTRDEITTGRGAVIESITGDPASRVQSYYRLSGTESRGYTVERFTRNKKGQEVHIDQKHFPVRDEAIRYASELSD